MMRNHWAVLVLLGMLFAAPAALHAEEATLEGEPVDIGCYTTKGLKGSAHAGCATACAVNKGQPVGFLVEGEEGEQLYLVMGSGDASPADLLGEHMGKQVQVTGEVAEKSGMKVISVASVEAAGETEN